MTKQIHKDRPETVSHPFNSLLILLGLVFTGALVGGILALLIGMVLTGVTDMATITGALTGQTQDLAFFRIVQGGSALGMFALPPFFLGLIEGDKFAYIPRERPGTMALYLLTLLIVCFSGPISDFLGELNAKLTLPERWFGLETWMRQQEEQIGEVTLQLLRDTSLFGLLGNLVVIAAIAAIGEELLFRGALQTILLRWFRNPHLAIAVTAVIFSAIHMQFYGFLPRLYLGVIFGYLFFWSGNIWLPIFAHFINNAAVVVSVYVMQRRGHALDGMDYGFDIPDFVYFISFVIVVLALRMVWLRTRRGGSLEGPETVSTPTLQ